MENVTDALYMAGAMLIFIVALTVAISSFTTLRAGVEEIVGQTETYELARNGETYINYIKSNNAVRLVGAETVVSSMNRAIKENYVVYIKFSTISKNELERCGITVAKAGSTLIASDGTTLIASDDEIVKVTIGRDTNQHVDQIFSKTDQNNGSTKLSLYELIKDMEFYEYLGEYQNNTNVTEENKTTFRIITYVEKT